MRNAPTLLPVLTALTIICCVQYTHSTPLTPFTALLTTPTGGLPDAHPVRSHPRELRRGHARGGALASIAMVSSEVVPEEVLTMATSYCGYAYYGHPYQVRCLAPSAFCEVIAEVCGVGKSSYYLGTTRMFFRMGAAAFLEELQVHAYHGYANYGL